MFSSTGEYIVTSPKTVKHIMAPKRMPSKPENNVRQRLLIPTAYTNYCNGAKLVSVLGMTSILAGPTSQRSLAISLYTACNSLTVGAS